MAQVSLTIVLNGKRVDLTDDLDDRTANDIITTVVGRLMAADNEEYNDSPKIPETPQVEDPVVDS